MSSKTFYMEPNAPVSRYPFSLGMGLILLGGIMGIGAALTTFSIPILATILLITTAIVPALIFKKLGFPSQCSFKRRMGLIWIAGCILIILVLSYFGNERIRQWRPHPAGYQIAWGFLLMTIYQIKDFCRIYPKA
jgi:hypothetical protein